MRTRHRGARGRWLAATALIGTALCARTAVAQDAVPMTTSKAVPVAQPPNVAITTPPFATSLQIAAPGPQAEANGLSYHFTLSWSPRASAATYRVFMWTDAVRTWYRISQTTSTTTDAHAFRSGCTAFMVIAFADADAPGSSMTGLEASNVLRFPLSQQPNLCPMRHP